VSAVRRAADEATVLRLETATYTVPTDAPEADGTLAWDSTTLVVVHAFAADGTTGLGWTYAGRACQTLIDDQLTGSVLGRSALDVPGCLEAMVRACRNLGRPGVVSCAIAAVELAMWDLKARLLGLPLCRLLGQVHEQVPVYGSGGFTSYDDAQLRAQLELWTQELRIPRVKIKIGESWGACEQRDLARVRQAREVVGPDVARTSTPTAGTRRHRRCGSGSSWPSRTSPGSRSRSPPTTWPAWRGSAGRCGPMSRRGSTATASPTSDGCARPARSTACRSTSRAAEGSPSGCGRRRSRQRTGWTSARTALRHCTHVAAAAVSNLRHMEYFHDHVRIEHLLFDGALQVRDGALTPDAGRPGLGLELRRGRRAVPGGLTAGRGNA